MTSDDHVHHRPAAGAPAEVNLDIDVAATGLYPLRAAVAAHATELGMSEQQLDRFLVVATELATNVIRHGGGNGRLRLWRSGPTIVCQVDDDGPGINDPNQVGLQQVPLGAVGGRGLWIVRQFCDTVSVTSSGQGTTVTATFAI
jgi:anti-sigma regulatory factor (Ser/Thr protein kinase)